MGVYPTNSDITFCTSREIPRGVISNTIRKTGMSVKDKTSGWFWFALFVAQVLALLAEFCWS